MIKRYFAVLFLLIFSQSCQENRKEGLSITYQNTLDSTVFYPVTKIVDGDTFWIDNGTSKEEKIRLIGVDTPETRRTSKKEFGYYGQEAKAYLKKLIINQKVELMYDLGRKDRYGRTLAYVYLADGTFVNAELLKNGYATVMTVQPNVKFVKEFLKLERQARQNKVGLWGNY